MKGTQRLRRYFQDLTNSEVYYMGSVKSVDKEKDTCTVEVDGLEYKNIQLSATKEGTKGQKLYPKVGSDVVVEKITSDTHAVRLFSEIEAFVIEINGLKFEAAELFEIKKGNETLLKILQDVIREVSLILPTQGTPPNVPALMEISLRAAQLLK